MLRPYFVDREQMPNRTQLNTPASSPPASAASARQHHSTRSPFMYHSRCKYHCAWMRK